MAIQRDPRPLSKDKILALRVTQNEHERVTKEAKKRGFKKTTHFLEFLIFGAAREK